MSYRSDLKALTAQAATLEQELAELNERIEVEKRRARAAQDKIKASSLGCGCVLAFVVAPWLSPLVFFAFNTCQAQSSMDETARWRVRASSHNAVAAGATCESRVVRQTASTECYATLSCGESALPSAVGTCAGRTLEFVYWSDELADRRAVLSARARRGLWKTEDGVILLEE